MDNNIKDQNDRIFVSDVEPENVFKDLKIGDEIRIKCVEDDDMCCCYECVFAKNCNENLADPICHFRTDGKPVHFELVKS